MLQEWMKHPVNLHSGMKAVLMIAVKSRIESVIESLIATCWMLNINQDWLLQIYKWSYLQ